MASKTLREAIERAFCKGSVKDVKERLINELRDYAAHRTMILGEYATAKDLFDEIFKDVPAFKK